MKKTQENRISRRQFFKRSAAGAAAVTAVGAAGQAQAMEVELGNHSYNYIKRGKERRRVFSCSPITPHDNPIEAWVEDDPLAPPNPLTHLPGPKIVEISGVTESVRSRGRISAAEASAWFQVEDNDRLLKPLKRKGKRGAGEWQEISWEQALSEIAVAVKASRPTANVLLRGKDTSGGALDRFMRTLGSNTVVSLEGNANQRAAWLGTWGSPESIPDLAHSHYILNFGSNFLVTQPDYAAEAMDGRIFRRARLVTFDPRCSKTAGLSDEWVPLRPGTDGIVALAMVRYLLKKNWADREAISKYSNYSVVALEKAVEQYTLEKAAQVSGLSQKRIRRVAREFSESGRGCILTGAGISGHSNGFVTEQALMLLLLVTGNIEVQGGNCYPRTIELGQIVPEPPEVLVNPVQFPARFPLDAGKAYPVSVVFAYNCNPVFDAPGSALWRQILADESRVGLLVAIATFKNETAELADLVLPEAHWLERNEPVQSMGSLLPWVGLRQQVITMPGEAKELRQILRDIIQAAGNPEQTKYWQFSDTRSWLGLQLGGIPGLQKDGGWELMAAHSGVWPVYGYLDPEKRRIVDEQGEEVFAEYGKPAHMEFSVFPDWQEAVDTKRKDKELTLLLHASDYIADTASANNKVLMETTLANHLHLNFETAKTLGFVDGDLVRMTSKVGYLVTKVLLTQTVRPDVVTMHREGGHWSVGGVASGKAGPKQKRPMVSNDQDINHNLWWTDIGVHPMDLIFPVFDSFGGGGALATAVTLERPQAGDHYGDVQVDEAKMLALLNSQAAQEGSQS
ncbi:MAG TPA: hypothetical protein ENI62_07470 [Gammaproteobacteria bacterium]|nr:hypothetical protein [Gammaproteobacteria bacterium]